MGVRPSDLVDLPLEEKLDLISKLWDSIEASAAAPSLTEEQQRELTSRRTSGLGDPAATTGWSVVKKSLFGNS